MECKWKPVTGSNIYLFYLIFYPGFPQNKRNSESEKQWKKIWNINHEIKLIVVFKGVKYLSWCKLVRCVLERKKHAEREREWTEFMILIFIVDPLQFHLFLCTFLDMFFFRCSFSIRVQAIYRFNDFLHFFSIRGTLFGVILMWVLKNWKVDVFVWLFNIYTCINVYVYLYMRFHINEALQMHRMCNNGFQFISISFFSLYRSWFDLLVNRNCFNSVLFCLHESIHYRRVLIVFRSAERIDVCKINKSKLIWTN